MNVMGPCRIGTNVTNNVSLGLWQDTAISQHLFKDNVAVAATVIHSIFSEV